MSAGGLVHVDPDAVAGLLQRLRDITVQLDDLTNSGDAMLKESASYWQAGSRQTVETYFESWKAETVKLNEQLRGDAIPRVETWLEQLKEVAHTGLRAV